MVSEVRKSTNISFTEAKINYKSLINIKNSYMQKQEFWSICLWFFSYLNAK